MPAVSVAAEFERVPILDVRALVEPSSSLVARRAVAELLGTSLLVMIVVGSGIAAQQLSPGDVGLQLLQNSTATVLGLTVLILVFGPIGGAHGAVGR